MQFHLLGDKSTQVGLNSHVVLVIVVETAHREALVHRTKSLGLLMESHVDSGDVAHREGHICLCGPSTLAVKVGHTQLINPDNTTLGRGRIVAHTNQHDTHLAQ